jgi:hypothetical protein
MSKTRRPPLKHCPVCGVSMVASKSRPAATTYDTFNCLNCDAVLRDLGAEEAEGRK